MKGLGIQRDLQLPELPEPLFGNWQTYIENQCGLFLGKTRKRFLQQRLWERMKLAGEQDAAHYFRQLQQAGPGSREWPQLLEHLLVRESSFYRHAPSYRALGNHMLPRLMQRRNAEQCRQLHFWSAGCANGQEPYSIAMCLDGAQLPPPWEVRILATDISQQGLAIARTGFYREFETRNLPRAWRHQYFQEAVQRGKNGLVINRSIRALVHFKQLNLLAMTLQGQPRWDVVFCQNLLIYLRKENQYRLANLLSSRLKPGGYLVLAPAEAMGWQHGDMALMHWKDTAIYQKKG